MKQALMGIRSLVSLSESCLVSDFQETVKGR